MPNNSKKARTETAEKAANFRHCIYYPVWQPVMISARFKFRTPSWCRVPIFGSPAAGTPLPVGASGRRIGQPPGDGWAARRDPKCNSGVFYEVG